MSERKRTARIFKMRGLSVQSSALDALLNVLRREREQSVVSSTTKNNDTLFAIIDEIKDRMIQTGNGTNVVTTQLLEEVVAELSRDAKDVTEEAVQMLDAFRTPRLVFETMRKQFDLVREKRTLYGEAVDKVRCMRCSGAITTTTKRRHICFSDPYLYYSFFFRQVDMFGQRYALIQQRILRQDIFQHKLATARHGRSSSGGATHALTPVESLLGRSGVRYLLGMIVQVSRSLLLLCCRMICLSGERESTS